MTDVRITEDGMLSCPCCDNQMNAPYLHHGAVTIYNRHEDAEYLTATQISSGQATTAIVPSRWSGNPSARRDGFKTEFSCGNCGAISELTLAQHNGQTILAWRHP